MNPTKSKQALLPKLSALDFADLTQIRETPFAKFFEARYQGEDVVVKALKTLWGDVSSKRTESILEQKSELLRLNIPSLVDFRFIGLLDLEPPASAVDNAVQRPTVGMVSERVKGKRLAAIVLEEGPLDDRETVELGHALAEALAAVHTLKNFYHGYLNPENVLRGDAGWVLIDLLMVQDGDSSEAGHPYRLSEGSQLSIEQRDLFALGAVLHYARSGLEYGSKQPGVPGGESLLARAGTDPEVRHLIEKLLDENALRNFESAKHLRAELEDLRDVLSLMRPAADRTGELAEAKEIVALARKLMPTLEGPVRSALFTPVTREAARTIAAEVRDLLAWIRRDRPADSCEDDDLDLPDEAAKQEMGELLGGVADLQEEVLAEKLAAAPIDEDYLQQRVAEGARFLVESWLSVLESAATPVETPLGENMIPEAAAPRFLRALRTTEEQYGLTQAQAVDVRREMGKLVIGTDVAGAGTGRFSTVVLRRDTEKRYFVREAP